MSKNESTTFSPRDLELLTTALQCNKGGEISIDYAAFALKAGFKNANSAKASWHGLKKKLQLGVKEGADATTPPVTPGDTAVSTPTSGKKRKAAEGKADDDGAEATPTKAKAKRGRKPKKADQEQEPEEADAVPSVEDDGKDEAKIKLEAEDVLPW